MQCRIYWPLGILFILSSCTHFQTGRSYLTEMEHDSSHFFSPEEDFPVVAGDTGELGLSPEEQRRRTPISEEDLAEKRFESGLKQELRELENSQSEDSLSSYEENKKYLRTVSERIYYLKLSPLERKEYLLARGLVNANPTRTPASAGPLPFGVRKQNVSLGMSKDHVRESLGRPSRVEIAGNPSFENERWAYQMRGATKYIYFEGGQVQGWE